MKHIQILIQTSEYSDGTSKIAEICSNQAFGALNLFNDVIPRKKSSEDFLPSEVAISFFVPLGCSILKLTIKDLKKIIAKNEKPHIDLINRTKKPTDDLNEIGNPEIPVMHHVVRRKSLIKQEYIDRKYDLTTIKVKDKSVTFTTKKKIKSLQNNALRATKLTTPEHSSADITDSSNTSEGKKYEEKKLFEKLSEIEKRAYLSSCRESKTASTIDSMIQIADAGSKLQFSIDYLPSAAYFVLDGTLRLQLERSKIVTRMSKEKNLFEQKIRSSISKIGKGGVEKLLTQMGEVSISDFEVGSLIFLDEKCFDVKGRSNFFGNKAGNQWKNLPPSELKAVVMNNGEASSNVIKNESKVSITLAKDVLLDPDGVRQKWKNSKGRIKSTPNRFQSAAHRALSTTSTLLSLSSKSPTKSAVKQLHIIAPQANLKLSSTSCDSYVEKNQKSTSKTNISKRILPSLRERNSPITKEANNTSFATNDNHIVNGESRYKLNFLFEKPTTLMAIPMDDVKIALNELAMRDSNDGKL